ncbi:MAG: ABC transporter ATP-binding protein, partial [Cyanobacteria bacterium]|nr:ABC transporter ATP-binding protein [Cyanobacteriota bacterium]
MFSGGAPIHLGWSRMFDPKKPTIEKPVDWRRIGKLFAPYWKQELQVLACVGLVSVLGLASPLVSMWIIDKAIPAADFRLVAALAGVMMASAVLSSLAGVYQGYLNAVVGEGIMRDLRVALLSHLQRMPLDFFTNTKTGEIMNRVSNDVDSINGVVSGTLMSIVTNLFVMASTLVTIFLLDWRLAFASLLLLPAMVLPMWPVGRRLYEARSTSREKRDEIHAVEQETLSVSGIVLLKSFVREDYERQRFLDLSSALMNTEIKLAMIGRWFMALIAAMIVIGPACIWLFGGWLCIYHGVTLGTVVSFIALLARLYSPAATLAGVQTQFVSALAVFERIFDYLDMKEESYSLPDTPPLGEIDGEVVFDDVTFSYPDGREALKNISFRVRPGQLAAFVGPSGAGKTTISLLVP